MSDNKTVTIEEAFTITVNLLKESQSENQQLKELLKDCNYLMFESGEYTEGDLDRLAMAQDKLKEILGGK